MSSASSTSTATAREMPMDPHPGSDSDDEVLGWEDAFELPGTIDSDKLMRGDISDVLAVEVVHMLRGMRLAHLRIIEKNYAGASMHILRERFKALARLFVTKYTEFNRYPVDGLTVAEQIFYDMCIAWVCRKKLELPRRVTRRELIAVSNFVDAQLLNSASLADGKAVPKLLDRIAAIVVAASESKDTAGLHTLVVSLAAQYSFWARVVHKTLCLHTTKRNAPALQTSVLWSELKRNAAFAPSTAQTRAVFDMVTNNHCVAGAREQFLRETFMRWENIKSDMIAAIGIKEETRLELKKALKLDLCEIMEVGPDHVAYESWMLVMWGRIAMARARLDFSDFVVFSHELYHKWITHIRCERQEGRTRRPILVQVAGRWCVQAVDECDEKYYDEYSSSKRDKMMGSDSIKRSETRFELFWCDDLVHAIATWIYLMVRRYQGTLCDKARLREKLLLPMCVSPTVM